MNDIYDVSKELGIEFQKYEHPPIYTVEEAQRHRGTERDFSCMPGGLSQAKQIRSARGLSPLRFYMCVHVRPNVLFLVEVDDDLCLSVLNGGGKVYGQIPVR